MKIYVKNREMIIFLTLINKISVFIETDIFQFSDYFHQTIYKKS